MVDDRHIQILITAPDKYSSDGAVSPQEFVTLDRLANLLSEEQEFIRERPRRFQRSRTLWLYVCVPNADLTFLSDFMLEIQMDKILEKDPDTEITIEEVVERLREAYREKVAPTPQARSP